MKSCDFSFCKHIIVKSLNIINKRRGKVGRMNAGGDLAGAVFAGWGVGGGMGWGAGKSVLYGLGYECMRGFGGGDFREVRGGRRYGGGVRESLYYMVWDMNA